LSETESDTHGIGAARRWIFDEFEKISADCGGCLEVIYVSDTIEGERRIPEPTNVVSVLAIQKGNANMQALSFTQDYPAKNKDYLAVKLWPPMPLNKAGRLKAF